MEVVQEMSQNSLEVIFEIDFSLLNVLSYFLPFPVKFAGEIVKSLVVEQVQKIYNFKCYLIFFDFVHLLGFRNLFNW